MQMLEVKFVKIKMVQIYRAQIINCLAHIPKFLKTCHDDLSTTAGRFSVPNYKKV